MFLTCETHSHLYSMFFLHIAVITNNCINAILNCLQVGLFEATAALTGLGHWNDACLFKYILSSGSKAISNF